ncbi:hypothetical protein ACP6OY_002210 [Cronobacter sakazakii]|nr:hypothetical protein [Cronobacter sakazakii]
MKLIDLLVQELPKHGGWPLDKKHHAFISQDSDGEVWAFPSKPNLNIMKGEWNISHGDGCYVRLLTTIADDFTTSTVTREQYEAALAAAQKPVWGGEGLPPVGVDIEYRFTKVNYRNDFSRGKVLAYGNQTVFMEHGSSKNEFIQPLSNIEFRPIRSEADRKREIGVIALATSCGDVVPFKYGDRYQDGELVGTAWYELYDKIAAGEVAGIRIE